MREFTDKDTAQAERVAKFWWVINHPILAIKEALR